MATKLFVRVFLIPFLLLALLSFTACTGLGTPAPAPNEITQAPAEELAALEVPTTSPVDAPTTTAVELPGVSTTEINRPAGALNRMIIKNAELELLVEDTDTVINRSLGIVTECGGYIISNRTWFNNEFKYATLTLGVPVENFEALLRRLKGQAISVTNETASGQDVTDQVVDLESRLRNLEATADRIREFLDQTDSVAQALEVNTQLTQVEAEIEQVKGQMVYMRDRAAFSTITMQISPQLPLPTPAPEPTPLPTLEPWSVASSFNNAASVTSDIAQNLFQVIVDLVIWVIVVILPFVLPIVGLAWVVVHGARRMGITLK